MEETTRGITVNVILYGNYQEEKTISKYKYSADPINLLNLYIRKGYYRELNHYCIDDPYYFS